MTRTIIPLPCEARELESALHALCDHAGLWHGSVRVEPGDGLEPDTLVIEEEPQGENT